MSILIIIMIGPFLEKITEKTNPTCTIKLDWFCTFHFLKCQFLYIKLLGLLYFTVVILKV